MSDTAPKSTEETLLEETHNSSTLSEEEKIAQIATHFAEIMRCLGLDMRDSTLKHTPQRVARMYVRELFRGLSAVNKPRIELFENTHAYGETILEKDIYFFSCCEHHFVPIEGKAQVAYISSGKIIGLSKINRIVHYYARRPQVQERLTQQIATELSEILKTEDVAVKIEATHFCVVSRGVSDINSRTHTRYLGGRFQKRPLREEFLSY